MKKEGIPLSLHPQSFKKTSSYLCLASSLPPSLHVPKSTLHTQWEAETTFCACSKEPPQLPFRTCGAKTPLHFTPVSISRWMLFLLCCSDASAQGSPSAYSTRFSMHAEQLQQQHLIELLHAARSATFYIKQTYFCRSSIVTWQNLERFPPSISRLLVYSSPQPVSQPQEPYVCGRTGREVQFVFIGCQASASTHWQHKPPFWASCSKLYFSSYISRFIFSQMLCPSAFSLPFLLPHEFPKVLLCSP